MGFHSYEETVHASILATCMYVQNILLLVLKPKPTLMLIPVLISVAGHGEIGRECERRERGKRKRERGKRKRERGKRKREREVGK